MELKLMFVGFTNDPVGGPEALIVATNCGNVTILVDHLEVRTNDILPGVFHGDYGISSLVPGSYWPAPLRPHETVLFAVNETNLDHKTYVYCHVQRHQPADRFYLRASGTLLDSFLSSPPADMAFCGPITNLPSDTASPDPPRVARP
jgi:hypothetical protein